MAERQFRLGRHGAFFPMPAAVPRIEWLSPPKQLRVPLWQYHPSVPLELQVKKGDRCAEGAVLALPLNRSGVAALAPAAGVVEEIESVRLAGIDRPESGAVRIQCATCADAPEENPVGRETPETGELSLGGLRGLGGAGFPVHLKIGGGGLSALVINLMESDPEILCDRALAAQTGAERIARSVWELAEACGIPHVLLAVPEGSEAIPCSRGTRIRDVRIARLPAYYAFGESGLLLERLLATGQIRAAQAIRSAVLNLQSALAAHEYLTEGKPSVSRLVTVADERAGSARVLRVPFGASVRDVCEAVDPGVKSPVARLGGFAADTKLDPDDVIGPMTNSIVLAGDEDGDASAASPCIGCGWCADCCPARINPKRAWEEAKRGEIESSVSAGLLECVLCGSCDMACPSGIPLVQTLRRAQEAHRESVRAASSKRRAEARKSSLSEKRAQSRLMYTTDRLSSSKESDVIAKLVAGASGEKPRPRRTE